MHRLWDVQVEDLELRRWEQFVEICPYRTPTSLPLLSLSSLQPPERGNYDFGEEFVCFDEEVVAREQRKIASSISSLPVSSYGARSLSPELRRRLVTFLLCWRRLGLRLPRDLVGFLCRQHLLVRSGPQFCLEQLRQSGGGTFGSRGRLECEGGGVLQLWYAEHCSTSHWLELRVVFSFPALALTSYRLVALFKDFHFGNQRNQRKEENEGIGEYEEGEDDDEMGKMAKRTVDVCWSLMHGPGSRVPYAARVRALLQYAARSSSHFLALRSAIAPPPPRVQFNVM